MRESIASNDLQEQLTEVTQQLKQREAELGVIRVVQQGLMAQVDMQGIYDLVGDRLRDLFDAQVVGIISFDHENRTEYSNYAFEEGERVVISVRPYDKLRCKLIDEKRPLLISQNAPEEMSKINGKPFKPFPGTRMAQSALYVPMVVGETVKGYVTLQNNDRENAFSNFDVRLLGTLANSMIVALENARLFNETEQANAELAVINSVQEGLVAEMDLEGIYELVGEKIKELFDAQVTAIVIFDHEDKTEHFKYLFENGERLNIGSRPYDKVREKIIREGSFLLFNENAQELYSEINGEPFFPAPGTKFSKSSLYVPMKSKETVRGYVTLQNLARENAFSDSDVRLLSTLVNSMSVALENARLFRETEQRNAELAVINSVQKGLVAEMDMQSIYEMVGDRLRDLFDSQVTGIATFDLLTGTENFQYLFEEGKRIYPKARPIDKFRRSIIKSGSLLLVNEKVDEFIFKVTGIKSEPVEGTRMPLSFLFVPLKLGEEVKGVVTLQNNDRENAFSESDVRLLSTLANSMSIALESARLFNETEQRATELQTVNNISRALVSQLEFNALIQLIGDQMLQTFRADIVYLALYDKEKNLLHFPYIHGETAESRPFGNGITEKIILNREPLLINQDMEIAYNKIEAERKGTLVESFLGVPIIAGNEAIGAISVQSTEQKNRFTENDLRLLTTIAANVGVAMQNAEAYRKLQGALTHLKAVQEQLVQQEKLASLGQLTAGIAHEIKNPLNFVNNFSDLNEELIDEVFEELDKMEVTEGIKEIREILVDLKSNLKKIHQHGTRADGIVKSMLQHSRGGSGKIEPTDLNALIREYVNLSFHGMRAGKKAINVSIDLQLDEKVEKVPLVAEDFSRVILNLCNNAFDAMREKFLSYSGKVEYIPKLSIRTFSENGNVNIQVQDNGPGIPEGYRDKILQPFFTTKKGTDGTGLGLSITHDIIKAHKGSLKIDSEEDTYTSFNILLPNTSKTKKE